MSSSFPTRTPEVAAPIAAPPLAPSLEGRAKMYLLPGQLHVSAVRCQFTTILGSCVAVCLWDRKLRVGGMNHYILPAWRGGEGPSTRFGDLAIEELLKRMTLLGCQRQYLVAKLFGGAALFRGKDLYANSLGAQNVDIARRLLSKASVPVAAEDIGGLSGRKIIFNSDDGFAWSRPV